MCYKTKQNIIRRRQKSDDLTVRIRIGQEYKMDTVVNALKRCGGIGTAANVAEKLGCRIWTAQELLWKLVLHGRIKPIKRRGTPFRAYAIV